MICHFMEIESDADSSTDTFVDSSSFGDDTPSSLALLCCHENFTIHHNNPCKLCMCNCCRPRKLRCPCCTDAVKYYVKPCPAQLFECSAPAEMFPNLQWKLDLYDKKRVTDWYVIIALMPINLSVQLGGSMAAWIRHML